MFIEVALTTDQQYFLTMLKKYCREPLKANDIFFQYKQLVHLLYILIRKAQETRHFYTTKVKSNITSMIKTKTALPVRISFSVIYLCAQCTCPRSIVNEH